MINIRHLKLALVSLLFLCILPMPYGYYELVRFVMLIGCSLLAYQQKLKEHKAEMLIFIVLALLFQPFFKIALGKTIWNIVDVMVGIYLLAS
ncbi:MAG: DUF6804 family protein [Pedobacter sp.]